MNKKVITLTKIFLKTSFQGMEFQKQKSKNNKNIGYIILYGILFLYLAGLIGIMSYGMIHMLASIGQEKVFLGLFFLVLAAFMLIQNIFSSLNVLYFAKDIEYLLPLPIKPREMVQAKLNTILITEYIMELIIGITPLIIYGILTGAGILYYFAMIIILLVFPILPVLISTLIIMIIMAFSKLTKNRDKFQLITSLIAIVFIVGIQFAIGGKDYSEEQMVQQLLKANGMVEMITPYFVTIDPAIQALTASNWLGAFIEIIKIIAISAGAYIIFLLAGTKLYLKGAVGSLVGASKKVKKLKEKNAYRKNKVGISYVKKELKILIRNPIYFMQCVLPALLIPVVFIIAGLSGFMSQEGNVELNTLKAQIQPFLENPITICVLLCILQFFSMMIYVSATAISRDGKNAIFVKYIPLSLYKQFIYKAIPNIIMSIIAILVTLAVATYIINLPISINICIFVISFVLSVIQSYLMLLVDLKKPKLEWDTEYAVVKQNMNLMWPAILGVVNIGIIIALTILFSWLPYWGYSILLFTITIIILLILQKYIKRNQVKLFEKIY
ncbi:MAG TPA: hypothetical protein IAB70_01680 [Candidatus Merdicola faecigallinarum]|uniref:ABC-2 type transport system permease protein n=1 Tax=Candidatus Merdicola faecigallinarum TaxID=2840862 RepID=A0A9D1M0F1_9FIRM|nr:hypothetical protein [Candidatus Merdicola faecigallinarum]